MSFNIINMNARLYDPLTGRMLSPDNVLATGAGTQAINRYTYANNNPLKYTDPDGNFAFLAPVLIGAMVGGLSYAVQASIAGELNNGQLLTAMLQGGVSGAVSYGVGSVIQGMSLVGTSALFTSAVAHSITQGFVSSLFNQQVTWQSFASGFASSLVGGAVNIATNSNPWATLAVGTMAGGISSAAMGGSFLEGAAIGLAVTGFNHLMHPQEQPMETKEEQNPPDDFILSAEHKTLTIVSTQFQSHSFFVQNADGTLLPLDNPIPFTNPDGTASGYDRATNREMATILKNKYMNPNARIQDPNHKWYINKDGLTLQMTKNLALQKSGLIQTGTNRFQDPFTGGNYLNAFPQPTVGTSIRLVFSTTPIITRNGTTIIHF
jgi:RHS repeat-associated protein